MPARTRFDGIVSDLGLKTVAEALGIDMSAVSMIRTGKRNPSFAVAATIERECLIKMIDWSDCDKDVA